MKRLRHGRRAPVDVEDAEDIVRERVLAGEVHGGRRDWSGLKGAPWRQYKNANTGPMFGVICSTWVSSISVSDRLTAPAEHWH